MDIFMEARSCLRLPCMCLRYEFPLKAMPRPIGEVAAMDTRRPFRQQPHDQATAPGKAQQPQCTWWPVARVLYAKV